MGEVASEQVKQVEEQAFEFGAGLYGFPGVKRFLVVDLPGGGDLFKQMIAVEDPEVAFTIVFPFAFFPQYSPDIPEDALAEVGAENPEQILLYVMAAVPANFKESTANLRAPLIFNPFTRKARQVILADDRLSTRERLFKA